ncbi:MAG: protein from nitrogen regulatory protein P-II (GLNB) family, ortholog YAAQ B. subtilis [uncultured Thermomicrobiales bacterium]|uniref:Protein from nitrogen regulatory protein P-II (GLNB) family, ortholog YAAQ B. subtilis n=1 Tax=uncultured Thermomicrobiales bacterium TaxID=1645740 RepID=A0A6J4U643_9BACT|nr:MAG: protein from nitrogen regulatory protein P-II (GLNB) family, ortholog YAAQ B. subtilis [uncultured Thermomicrobiales bacterium]
MKLVIAIVQSKDADALVGALAATGHFATRVDSAGGFLRECNVTLFLGVPDDAVSAVTGLIGRHCQARRRFVNPLVPVMAPTDAFVAVPVEVEIGGATIFVLKVERFERTA